MQTATTPSSFRPGDHIVYPAHGVGRVMRLYGDCRRFYIVGENSVNNETFSVSSMAVRFTPGNME